MKKVNLNNRKNEQAMGLTTLSNDELKNVYGGKDVYFIQRIEKGQLIWSLVVKQLKGKRIFSLCLNKI